jgi:hypothetical protein
MEDQIFSDGIGQVSIIGGTVRLDFVTLSPTEKDAKGQPTAIFSQRVIMGVDGFMQSAAKIQEAAQAVLKLAQRPRDGQTQQAAEPATSAPAPVSAPGADQTATIQKRPFP